MKRRDLLKALGLLGTFAVPGLASNNGIIKYASAKGFNISNQDLINAKAIVAGEINFSAPASLPTIINIFMYGGPSELAGNLTNLFDINRDSQNSYPNGMNAVGDETENFIANGGQVTANGFWQDAGGAEMEAMLAAGDMSIYRTINRIVEDTKAHRTSIFSTQTGNLDQLAPGMGTTVAAIFREFMSADFVSSAPLIPLASFEGDAVLFNPGDEIVPLPLRAVSLDSDFNNPFSRRRTYQLQTNSNCTVNGLSIPCHDALDDLAQRTTAVDGSRFNKLGDSFIKRRELDAFFTNGLGTPVDMIPNDAAGVPLANFSGRFGDNLLAACVLALENTDIAGQRGTRFITLSTGGLGGWDDHDNAMANNRFVQRMSALMSNVQQALILLASGTRDPLLTPDGATKGNGRSDVIINMYGEFGRNVNLNNSMGWDHGNNMNLYTFGGSSVPGRNMGQIIGTTSIIGTPGQNRLFTTPASGSPQYEPMSIAATVYKHFGVQNPEVLTNDTDLAPGGFAAIPGA